MGFNVISQKHNELNVIV